MQKTVTLAVMSGKGGVGKTNITLNTALALTRLGERVLVIDGDLGLANIDVLLGVTPAHSLQDVLTGDLAPEDAITEARPGLGLLPAASGAEDLICLSRASARALADSLTPCLSGYGFVLLDLGAGIGGNVIELARLSRLRVVVTTPEPTALTDSYALIKVMHRSLGTRAFSYVVNNVMDPEETDFTRERLEGACGHFLGFTPVFLGAVRQDPGLPAAVMEQIPLLEASPESPASKDITAIAENLFRQKKIFFQAPARRSSPRRNAEARLRKTEHSGYPLAFSLLCVREFIYVSGVFAAAGSPAPHRRKPMHVFRGKGDILCCFPEL